MHETIKCYNKNESQISSYDLSSSKRAKTNFTSTCSMTPNSLANSRKFLAKENSFPIYI